MTTNYTPKSRNRLEAFDTARKAADKIYKSSFNWEMSSALGIAAGPAATFAYQEFLSPLTGMPLSFSGALITSFSLSVSTMAACLLKSQSLQREADALDPEIDRLCYEYHASRPASTTYAQSAQLSPSERSQGTSQGHGLNPVSMAAAASVATSSTSDYSGGSNYSGDSNSSCNFAPQML